MPTTDKQLAQREKFLALYFDGPEEFRFNLKKAAAEAGYSKTSITFKQHKLRRYVEAARRSPRHAEQNPAATRAPMSGKLLPARLVLAEQADHAHGPDDAAVSSTAETFPALADVLAGFRDDQDGTGERIFF